jgi:hypothetical protein
MSPEWQRNMKRPLNMLKMKHRGISPLSRRQSVGM